MWVEAKNLCGRVEAFRPGEGEETEAKLIRQTEPCLWRLKNITKNPPRDATSKLKAGSSIEIDGVSVAVDATLVEEAAILSNIFSINDSHAVELLLSGESERLHYDLNRGLLAVACYYDAHRMLAEILRRILSWDREATTRTMRRFVKENFVNREIFKHLLMIQEQFTVASEFHTLMNPQVNGLGGARHQSILRNLIEEIRSLTGECVYLLAQYDPDQIKMFLSELYPKLKSFPIGEKLSTSNMVVWICVIRLTSSDFLTQVPNASSVLMDMVQEIRDETAWSDQSICGTVQLACAVSFRALAASPADHLTTETISFDVNRVLDRAVRNMCFHFLRLGIIGSEAFKQTATNSYVVNRLLTQIILHFPAKLIEIERNGEDELQCLDEMISRKQQATAFLHYEHFLRCIADLFMQFQDPTCPIDVKQVILNASIAYSSSLELCRFVERARLDLHMVHCIAYLDMLTAICLTQENAAFIFHVFNVDMVDTGFSWDRVMMALRDYAKFYRMNVTSAESISQTGLD
ncbi:hypothetical protein WR25_00983 isoform B [Diploscapter pachys]|uniref:Uncharacterized protein n=1 Tax=Diploscapter pachys TaxID=2018661 RepID=A0A2A2JVU1_9BILA|nr:hypothetical protein WR25_00983 isoform A [Diploscapter pachys]PAV65815.1 hypothetical protein WR25_00983 isoform B [Diploscapter pachys]